MCNMYCTLGVSSQVHLFFKVSQTVSLTDQSESLRRRRWLMVVVRMAHMFSGTHAQAQLIALSYSKAKGGHQDSGEA